MGACFGEWKWRPGAFMPWVQVLMSCVQESELYCINYNALKEAKALIFSRPTYFASGWSTNTVAGDSLNYKRSSRKYPRVNLKPLKGFYEGKPEAASKARPKTKNQRGRANTIVYIWRNITAPNQSSHLGIHKQTNACWSLPRFQTVFYHFKIFRSSAESGNYEDFVLIDYWQLQ